MLMLKNVTVTESVLGSGTKNFYLCKQEVLGMDAVLSRALFSRNCLSLNMVLLLLTLNIFCYSVLKETKTFASKSAVRNGLLVLPVTATVLQWTAIKNIPTLALYSEEEKEVAPFACQRGIQEWQDCMRPKVCLALSSPSGCVGKNAGAEQMKVRICSVFFVPLADWLGLLNWRLSLDYFPFNCLSGSSQPPKHM